MNYIGVTLDAPRDLGYYGGLDIVLAADHGHPPADHGKLFKDSDLIYGKLFRDWGPSLLRPQ